jgi:hypothetical protein
MKKTQYFFLGVLDTARTLQASDKRDFVYAFLGLPAAQGADGRPLVKPDYTTSKTANEVFVDVACALLRHEREALHALGFVQHCPRRTCKARSARPGLRAGIVGEAPLLLNLTTGTGQAGSSSCSTRPIFTFESACCLPDSS